MVQIAVKGSGGAQPVPFFFEKDAEHNVLRIYFTGQVSDPVLEEARQACALYFRDPQRACDTIVDFSQVEQFEVETKTIEKLAGMPPAVPADKTTIIVAPRPHVFGMFRMLTLLSGHKRPNMQVRRGLKEAFEVLGIESAEFRPVDVS
jgi:hypothetical protein